ncbi:MAG: hypothetical protein FIA95_05625 [Gemmatimonadetes bacterium]|nr:hypothetical protein [Gemmatimonadota bacterium]
MQQIAHRHLFRAGVPACHVSLAMAIPRILHQTWTSERLPPAFRACQESWRRHHPGWEYRFYDDGACRRVVEEGFPSLLVLYDACPHAVQRADIFRYLVVARDGGLYADMDVECLRNVEPLLEGRRAVFGVEDRLTRRRTRRLNLRHAERIANFIFAAEPGHPFFRVLVDRGAALPGGWDMEEVVLETTGPGMLTDLVQAHREGMGLTVPPRDCWAPRDLWPPRLFPFNRRVYARHHFAGTWKAALGGAGGGRP